MTEQTKVKDALTEALMHLETALYDDASRNEVHVRIWAAIYLIQEVANGRKADGHMQAVVAARAMDAMRKMDAQPADPPQRLGGNGLLAGLSSELFHRALTTANQVNGGYRYLNRLRLLEAQAHEAKKRRDSES